MKIEEKRESRDSETPAGKHANHKLIPFHQDKIFPQNKQKVRWITRYEYFCATEC